MTDRSAECFSVSENSEVIGDPEGTELEDEGLEGRVRLDVEGRVRHRSRSVHVVEHGLVVDPEHVVVVVEAGEVLKESPDVGLGAVVHQLDGRV